MSRFSLHPLCFMFTLSFGFALSFIAFNFFQSALYCIQTRSFAAARISDYSFSEIQWLQPGVCNLHAPRVTNNAGCDTYKRNGNMRGSNACASGVAPYDLL